QGAGGGNTTDAVNVNLTFDDAASGVIPDGEPLPSGTYKPASYVTYPFTPPAPTTADQMPLSHFNGTSPNGTWKLFIIDSASQDAGSLDGGWSLSITAPAPPTATADVVTVSESSGTTNVLVLANDLDPDNVGKSVASVTQPTSGQATTTIG